MEVSLNHRAGRQAAFAFAIGYTVHRPPSGDAEAIDVISTIPVAIPGLVIGVAYLCAWTPARRLYGAI